MRESKRKKLLSLYCAAFCLSVTGLAVVARKPDATQAKAYVADTFETSAIDCTPAQTLPEELNCADKRKGLLLSSGTEKSELAFNKNLCGDFSMDFRVFSDTTCGLTAVKNSKPSNTDLDLSLLSFEFSDIGGKSFKLYINGGGAYNNVSPNCYVQYNDMTGGIYYYDPKLADIIASNPGYQPTGTTEYMNENEVYTVINGTTFSNLAYFENGELSVKKAQSTQVLFSPEDMTVKVRAGTGKYYTVWDFSKEYNDGKKGEVLSRFTDYSVKIVLEKITSGATANMLIYNVCDMPFESYFESNKVQIFANGAENAVVGQKYTLPEAKVFSLVGGVQEFDGTVEAEYNDETIECENGWFIPETAGKYKLIYRLGNAVKEYAIEAFNEKDVINNYYIAGEYAEEVAKGAEICISEAKVVSNLVKNYSYIVPEVQLYLDGEKVRDFGKSDREYRVTLENNGHYMLRYFFENSLIPEKIFEFEVGDDTVSFVGINENETRFTGNILDLSSARAIVNGVEHAVSVEVTKPDGQVEKANKITLSGAGIYSVKLTYGEKSKTYSVKATNSVTDMFSSEKSVLSAATLPFTKLDGGLKVDAKYDGESVKYNGLIDFANKRKDDVFIRMLINPSEYRKADFYQYTIVLTDETNSENCLYVTCESTKTTNGSIISSYVRAGFGTKVAGVQNTGSYYYDYYGRTINSGFSGVFPCLDDCYMEYSYDSSANVVYARVNGKMTIVADLNREDIFGSKFEGFSTGKAELKIIVEKVQTGASYYITEIDRVKLSDNHVSDGKAPEIHINTEEYSYGALPAGTVNRAYPIFSAEAFDGFHGYINVGINVYSGYGKETQKEISVENNAFVPTEAGKYTIVYSARDYFGNLSKETLEVSVDNEAEALYANLMKDGNIVVDPKEECFVGEKVALLDCNYGGGSGNVKVFVSVTKDGKEIALQGKTFLASSAGIYSVKYKISDYINNVVTFEYTVKASVSDAPIIVSEAILPYALINGKSAELTPVSAIDYSDNGKSAEITLDVNYKGKISEKVDYRHFVPNVEKDGDVVELIFNARGANGVTQRKYEIVVKKPVENSILDCSKLFVSSDNVSIAQQQNSPNMNDGGVVFETSENANVRFINYLPKNIRAEFLVKENKKNFSALSVTITDSVYRENCVTIKYLNSEKLYMQLNDGRQYLLDGSFGGLPINFSMSGNRLMDTTNALIGEIRQYDNGNAFNGFISNKLMLQISFEGVSGESEVLMRKLQEQQLGAIKDETFPEYVTNGELKKQCVVGEKLLLPSASGFDVVFGESRVTVSVKQGSKYIKSVDNVSLNEADASRNYEIQCSARGMFTITYQATDEAGNTSRTVRLFVYIKSDTKPNVSVAWNQPKKVAIGTSVTLPEASVISEEACTVTILVLNPNGRLTTGSDRSYTFAIAGKYKIRYYVQDSDYNAVIKEFEIIAE